ncbi:hypothetical protein BDR07DRAFT_1414469 [Suillus spraguei]|nr:hypothetical protein BDR07DRAFT_1414469 [Suillus spraguei]
MPANYAWVNEKVVEYTYNSLRSSDVKPLQLVPIIADHDSKFQQAVLTTASHDSKLQQAVSGDRKPRFQVSGSSFDDRKPRFQVSGSISGSSFGDRKPRFQVSGSSFDDRKPRFQVSGSISESSFDTASYDFKSQEAVSTTAGHDHKCQQAVSTAAVSDSKSLQSSSTVQSVLSEQSVSKAGQSVTKSELSAAKSATILEQSVTKSELVVSQGLAINTTELLAITKRTASITEDLSIAEKVLTKEITADAKNFASHANRSFVMARKLEWNRALQDANKSLAIRTSLAGYVAKGIALCGQQHIEDARMTFDLGFTLTEGNMDATWFLCLIKAIALFNANRHEEAMLREYALRAAYHSEAIEHFSVAVKAIIFLAQSAAPAVCEAFTVLFGWDIEQLWLTSNQNLIKALLGAGKLGEAFESYRIAMNASDKATMSSLHSWVLSESFQ